MPCRDDGPPPGYNPTVAENNRLTRLLCYTVNCQRDGIHLNNQAADNIDFHNWIVQHDKDDVRRIEREAKERKEKVLKRRALAKLTPEERKALKL